MAKEILPTNTTTKEGLRSTGSSGLFGIGKFGIARFGVADNSADFTKVALPANSLTKESLTNLIS